VKAAVRTLDLVKKNTHEMSSTTETIKEAVAGSGIRENAVISMNL
jgi:hypothetical protein